MNVQRQVQNVAAAAALAVLGMWAGTSVVRGDTLTLQMNDANAGSVGAGDTWIGNNDGAAQVDKRNNNAGAVYKLRVRTPGSSDPRQNALLKWPSLIGTTAGQQLPAGAHINSASLQLYTVDGVNAGDSGNVEEKLAAVAQDWDEGNGSENNIYTVPAHGATWLKSFGYGDGTGTEVDWLGEGAMGPSRVQVNGEEVQSSFPTGTPSTQNVWFSWDITNIVQGWADYAADASKGFANYGMTLFVDPISTGLNSNWLSRNQADSNHPQFVGFEPKLVIDYSMSVVSGSTWNVDGDGNWSVAGNWEGGVPNAAGATANFGTIITSGHTVTVDAPQTVGVVNFSSPDPNVYTVAGSSTLTLDGGSGSTSINVTAGSPVISAPIVLAKDTTVAVSGGGNLSVAHLRGAGLSITSGGMKVLANGSANSAAGTSKVTSLAIAPGASLDLTNNSAVIDYSGSAGTLVDDVRQMIGGGKLISSSADATRNLGYSDNAALGMTSFAGQTVDSSSVLVKYTYLGDTNLDGQVDVIDLGNLATAWQTSGVWANGDSNYDGFVDVIDLGQLATNWQAGVGSPLGPGSLDQALAAYGLPGVSVPEPATIGLMGIAMMGLGRRRR